MTRTFFPKKTKTIDASSHRPGADYVVGIGNEIWGTEAVPVLKIQMAYDGNVAGRKAPSFPIVRETVDGSSFNSCPDFDEVAAKVEEIVDPLRKWLITWDRPPNGPDVSATVCDAIKLVWSLRDEDLLQPCLQVRVIQIQASGTGSKIADQLRKQLRALHAPNGTRIFVARLADEGNVSI
jgi:hypothetical protein